MRYLQSFNESNSEEEVISELKDIVLEINDLNHWTCGVFPFQRRITTSLMGTQNQRMIRLRLSIIDPRIDEDDDDEWESYNPPPVVTEVFERAIEYMKMSGWEHHKIYFSDDSHDGIKEIKLEQIEDFNIYPNETIKIIFSKEPILHRYN